MNKEKFKISVIDFIPFYKKFPVGKYKDGSEACIGDTVRYKDENWIIAYRYGGIQLKQIGIWAMIACSGFKNGDFSDVEPTSTVTAGEDWLIIGYTDEPLFEKLRPLFEQGRLADYRGYQ